MLIGTPINKAIHKGTHQGANKKETKIIFFNLGPKDNPNLHYEQQKSHFFE